MMLISIGCSRQATITLRDGTELRGKIEQNQDGWLIADNPRSGQVAIRQDAIRDIRHPGGAAMAMGSVAFVTGSVMLLSALAEDCAEPQDSCADPTTGEPAPCERFLSIDLPSECESDRTDRYLLGLGVAIPGLAVGIYGANVHLDSKAKARERAGEQDAQSEKPATMRTLGITGRF